MSEIKVEIQRKKLDDLSPADYNPRKISAEAYSGLGASINRFGLLSHIVWNKRTGNIVGGHQRYKQLLEMGEEETDVVVVDLDDNEEVALNITLNNPHIRGDFTKDVMEQLRMTEVQLGNNFDKLGLLDLYEYLKDRGYDKKPKEKKPKAEVKEPQEKKHQEKKTEDDSKETKPEEKAKAVLTCPKCRSQWLLTDNKVVFNAVTGTGKPVGGKQ